MQRTTGTAQKLQDQLFLNVSCGKISKAQGINITFALSDETDRARQIDTAIIHDMY